MSDKSTKFINRNFPLIIYIFSVVCSLYLLYMAREVGLLPMPVNGTDQLGMLKAAADMYRGKMPGAGYMYSPVYTLFLFALVVFSHGKLIIMRILQALLCALIPVIIYKLTLRLRVGRPAAQISAVLYCFYGPAVLISLDFLRAGPLALCFVVMIYYLVSAFIYRSPAKYIAAGVFAGLCVLGRENFAPVIIAPMAMLLFTDVRKNIKVFHPVFYLAAAAAIVLPVMVYNFATHGAFAIVPGHVVNVIGAYHGENAVNSGQLAISSIMTNIPMQVYNFFCSYEIPNSLSYYSHREALDFLKIFIIPFNLLVALAGLGFGFRTKNRGIALIWIMIAVYGGSMVFFNMFYRFRIPVVPLVAALSGIGVASVYNVFKQKKYLQGIVAIIIVVVFLLFTWDDPNKRRPHNERRNVASFLIRNHRFTEAENYIDQMRQEKIQTKGLEIFLINAISKSGQPERARDLYRKWLQPKPESPQK
jgi:4-amino-4-deoxy-L-arabinose transferase-like glycosyltransferase